ncbi:hypothetical protein ACQP1G_35005 [Nocardia sp. CA-107356]
MSELVREAISRGARAVAGGKAIDRAVVTAAAEIR